MTRRVFFSFDYKHVWKVNQIRNIPNITGIAAAKFQDASLWEDAKKKGEKAVKAMIDNALEKTSVTVILITHGAADRKYIDYEIEQSLAQGNGLVAVRIHHLKDQQGHTGGAGAIPSKVTANGFKAYKYSDMEALARQIEEAAKIAGK